MDYPVCGWCGGSNQPGSLQCSLCGAPQDKTNLVSDSGWREAPRLSEMAEFRFSDSVLRVEGTIVPVAEISLSRQDSIFCEPRTMLWKEPQVALVQTKLQNRRCTRGMPYQVLVASGPGRIALCRTVPGELVVLPIAPGADIDARGHAFLVASHTVGYSCVRITGRTSLRRSRAGRYVDRFSASGSPGVLMLHGNGDVLQRTLGNGERILIEAGKFLYKDSSVQMRAVPVDGVSAGRFGRRLFMNEMVGPGRVGIQSMYRRWVGV